MTRTRASRSRRPPASRRSGASWPPARAARARRCSSASLGPTHRMRCRQRRGGKGAGRGGLGAPRGRRRDGDDRQAGLLLPADGSRGSRVIGVPRDWCVGVAAGGRVELRRGVWRTVSKSSRSAHGSIRLTTSRGGKRERRWVDWSKDKLSVQGARAISRYIGSGAPLRFWRKHGQAEGAGDRRRAVRAGGPHGGDGVPRQSTGLVDSTSEQREAVASGAKQGVVAGRSYPSHVNEGGATTDSYVWRKVRLTEETGAGRNVKLEVWDGAAYELVGRSACSSTCTSTSTRSSSGTRTTRRPIRAIRGGSPPERRGQGHDRGVAAGVGAKLAGAGMDADAEDGWKDIGRATQVAQEHRVTPRRA